MLEQLQGFIALLGSYKEAADYLGYSTRQLYNIRKCLERGDTLPKHVAVYLSRMISQHKRRKQTRRKGYRQSA